MAETSADRGADRRLNSWKEIAAFFGKDQRTVKRWETSRGLPVRRIPGGNGTRVFAYAGELEQWLTGGETAGAALASPATVVATVGQLQRTSWPNVAALTVLAAITLSGLVAIFDDAFSGRLQSVQSHVPVAEAQDLYLRGTFLWEKRTGDSLREAAELLTKATELDPQYAAAFAGLANTYDLLREYSVMPADQAYAKAAQAGLKAVALNPGDADAQSALAFAEFYGLRQLEPGIARFQLALGLDPKSAKIHHWLGNALLHLGRFDEALAEIEQAQRLDPGSRAIVASKGLALFCTGHIEEAVALLNELAEREPDYLSPHAYLAYVYLARGDYPVYLKELHLVGALRDDASRIAVADAGETGYAERGFDGMVEAMLAEEREQQAAGKTIIYNVARLEALSGRVDATIEGLKASMAAGEEYVMGLNIDPAFRLIRTSPDFRTFAASFGLTLVQ